MRGPVPLLIRFVRTHPNLGVSVSHSQDFLRYCRQLPIGHPLILAGASWLQKTGLVWTHRSLGKVSMTSDANISFLKLQFCAELQSTYSHFG